MPRRYFRLVCLLAALAALAALGSARCVAQLAPSVITNLPNTEITVCSFSGTNGANPQDGNGLLQLSDGSFIGTTQTGGNSGDGTIFNVTTSGSLTMLASFDGKNGQNPYANVIQGIDGNFYGTTYNGGTNGNGAGDGVLYEYSTANGISRLMSFGNGDGRLARGGLVQYSGTFFGVTENGGGNSMGSFYSFSSIIDQQLHSFAGTPDGSFPHCSLIQGPAGFFYGTTFNGGNNTGDGTVFRITTSGSIKTLYSFSGTDGTGPRELTDGTDGNLYGVTYSGGQNSDGTIFQLSTAGSLNTICSLNGTNGLNPQSGVVQGPDGNFYGVANLGGADQDGTAFEVTTSGSLTVMASFTGTNGNGTDGANPYGELTLGRDGNFYGTTVNGGASNDGTIFVLLRSATATQLEPGFAYQVTASGSPFNFSATGLPAGLSIDQNAGIISGTASVSGTFAVQIAATNTGGTGSAELYLLVLPEPVPVITSTNAATATGNYAFSYQITGSNSPTAFAGDSLPPGISVDPSSGLVSGTPTATGTFSAEIYASNAGGSGSSAFTVVVTAPNMPQVSNPDLTGTGDFPFSAQIDASNNADTYSATGLPPGVFVDAGSGLISGTPAATGTFTPTLFAGNLGGTGSAAINFFVVTPPAPSLSSSASTTGTSGSLFDYQVAVGNYPTSFTFDTLPNGLTLNAGTGEITGTPTTTGSYNTNIGAINLGGTGTQVLTIIVLPPPPVVGGLATASGSVGTAFSYLIAGSNSPDLFGATGLPGGLSVNSFTGLISGTPTTNGTFNATITAGNAGGTGTGNVFITINTNYPGIKGAFSGLGAVGGTSQALFSVSLTAKGVFTSKLTTQAGSYALKGDFSPSGFFVGVENSGKSRITASLQVNTGNLDITGTLGVEDTLTNISTAYTVESGLLGTYNKNTLPAGWAGRYTFLWVADVITSSTNPQGFGYGLGAVSTTGALTVSGELVDGTPYAFTSKLRAGNDPSWTFFAQPYPGKNHGIFAGAMFHEPFAETALASDARLIRPPGVSRTVYPAGFSIPTSADGEVYAQPLVPASSYTIWIGGGVLPAKAIIDALTISTKGKVAISNGSNAGDVKLSLAPATGKFSGTFLAPVTNLKTSFSGALLQTDGGAYGVFLSGSEAGSVQIIP